MDSGVFDHAARRRVQLPAYLVEALVPSRLDTEVLELLQNVHCVITIVQEVLCLSISAAHGTGVDTCVL
jgi:hypothetical protein